MAFTESQKLDICMIVGVTADLLEDILTFRAGAITSEVETKVEEQLTRWETAGIDFVKLHPVESNKGVETNPDYEKSDIRRNIANLLFLTEYVGGSGRLMRG